MNTYEFELEFKLLENENFDKYIDQLFEAGCNDATIGHGLQGFVHAMFHREAENALDAVSSAIDNILTAIPHAKLIKADPFLMNLSEMADLFKCTKQNLSKYATGKSAVKNSFPRPLIYGKTDYWHILDIAIWLKTHTKMDISDSTIEILKVIRALNAEIENRKIEKFEGLEAIAA
jgi:hypothetical protein